MLLCLVTMPNSNYLRLSHWCRTYKWSVPEATSIRKTEPHRQVLLMAITEEKTDFGGCPDIETLGPRRKAE